MQKYKPEDNADLEFQFPEGLEWSELDQQGVKLPERMKFVDIVIERDDEILLVEVKDPSNTRAPEEERKKYYKRLQDNSVLKKELTPKARDSYIFQHLMEKDSKPFRYIVLIGLDAFDQKLQKALLFGFKDRLFADIQCEAHSPWKRKHIKDCAVMSVEGWNKRFTNWPVVRLSNPATS